MLRAAKRIPKAGRVCRELQAANPAVLRTEAEVGKAHVKFSVRVNAVVELIQDQVVDKIVLERHGVLGGLLTNIHPLGAAAG